MNAKLIQENIKKASQTANLLIQDLQELMKSEDLQLANTTAQLLKKVKQIEQQLKSLDTKDGLS